MRIGELIQTKRPFVSLEFFPPKEREAWPAFFTVVERLLVVHPLFVSVTYGAGGSTHGFGGAVHIGFLPRLRRGRLVPVPLLFGGAFGRLGPGVGLAGLSRQLGAGRAAGDQAQDEEDEAAEDEQVDQARAGEGIAPKEAAEQAAFEHIGPGRGGGQQEGGRKGGHNEAAERLGVHWGIFAKGGGQVNRRRTGAGPPETPPDPLGRTGGYFFGQGAAYSIRPRFFSRCSRMCLSMGLGT